MSFFFNQIKSQNNFFSRLLFDVRSQFFQNFWITSLMFVLLFEKQFFSKAFTRPYSFWNSMTNYKKTKTKSLNSCFSVLGNAHTSRYFTDLRLRFLYESSQTNKKTRASYSMVRPVQNVFTNWIWISSKQFLVFLQNQNKEKEKKAFSWRTLSKSANL